MKNSRPSKRPHKNARATVPPRSPWREHLVVAGWVAVFMAVLALFCTVAGIINQRIALNRTTAKWKSLYHLTDTQAARIREIELEFHGNGNPFTSRDSGTPEENDAHHLEISRVMNPEDGARFARDMIGKDRKP